MSSPSSDVYREPATIAITSKNHNSRLNNDQTRDTRRISDTGTRWRNQKCRHHPPPATTPNDPAPPRTCLTMRHHRAVNTVQQHIQNNKRPACNSSHRATNSHRISGADAKTTAGEAAVVNAACTAAGSWLSSSASTAFATRPTSGRVHSRAVLTSKAKCGLLLGK